MWKVRPAFKLPQGYDIYEDTTGCYLITDEEIIGVFTHFADPQSILMAAINHKNNLQGVAM